GLHSNSSFGLSLAMPYARRQASLGRPALGAAIEAAACRWYAADFGYPAAWEPSGHDFLSPALAEAELMARVLSADEFGPWLAAFLPGLASGSPASLFTPVVVSDSSDGRIAHLHGLNLSRAWCFRRMAAISRAGLFAGALMKTPTSPVPVAARAAAPAAAWVAVPAAARAPRPARRWPTAARTSSGGTPPGMITPSASSPASDMVRGRI